MSSVHPIRHQTFKYTTDFDLNTDKKDINIKTQYDGPSATKLQPDETRTLNEYTEVCNHIGTNYGYCLNTDTIIPRKTGYINGQFREIYFGECNSNQITNDANVCRAKRTGDYLNTFYNSCASITDTDQGWCADSQRVVPVFRGTDRHKYQSVLSKIENGETKYGCRSKIVQKSVCQDPCQMNPTGKECLMRQYNERGGTASGNYYGNIMEGFETKNTDFFDNIIGGVMDIGKRVYNVLVPPIQHNNEAYTNKEDEGFATITKDVMDENLNTIKTTRNYDTYIDAWNNFTSNNFILDRTGNQLKRIDKKDMCENTNGYLYFNNPYNFECYQKEFLKKCDLAGTAYPTQYSDVNTSNLNTYKIKVDNMYNKAHQINTNLNNINEINEAHKQCHGTVRQGLNTNVGNQGAEKTGLLMIESPNNHISNYGGNVHINALKNTTPKIIHSLRNIISGYWYQKWRIYIEINGFLKYPKECAYVQYRLTSDDGSTLRINDVLVIEQWKLQGSRSKDSQWIDMTGSNILQSIQIKFYEWYGRQNLSLQRRMKNINDKYIDEEGKEKPGNNSGFHDIHSSNMVHYS